MITSFSGLAEVIVQYQIRLTAAALAALLAEFKRVSVDEARTVLEQPMTHN